jgi:hypothetical protein
MLGLATNGFNQFFGKNTNTKLFSNFMMDLLIPGRIFSQA